MKEAFIVLIILLYLQFAFTGICILPTLFARTNDDGKSNFEIFKEAIWKFTNKNNCLYYCVLSIILILYIIISVFIGISIWIFTFGEIITVLCCGPHANINLCNFIKPPTNNNNNIDTEIGVNTSHTMV